MREPFAHISCYIYRRRSNDSLGEEPRHIETQGTLTDFLLPSLAVHLLWSRTPQLVHVGLGGKCVSLYSVWVYSIHRSVGTEVSEWG